jgi:predicted MPP superfamily phosphohydrolase
MTAPPLQAALYILGAILLACGTHLLVWRHVIFRVDLPLAQRRIAGRLLFAGGILFPVGMLQLLLMRHMPRMIARPLMTTAFTWLGVIICLVWGVAAFELLRAVFRPAKRMQVFLARATVAAAIAMSALGVLLANTPPDVVITHFEVPAGFARYRIVQLSDAHIGPTLGRGFASRLADTVNALHPDLIVVTGDMVDGSVRELAPEVAPLKALVAREGVVFVPGNHEYLSGVEPWVKHVKSFGWRVLRNARVSLTDLDVVGLDDSWESSEAPEGLLARSAHRPLLLVAHQPQDFADACRAGVDLALAGHTHGGQIFPFGIWERLQQGYLKGAYSCGPTQLYVSSGAGYWGPPMRLGSRNEISVIELTGN